MPNLPDTRPQNAREIWAGRRKLPFIPTFSTKLNAIFGGGLRSTGVYVMTGSPGAGKTSCSLDFTDAAINAGHPVIYVSAELTPQLVIARYAGKKLGLGWLEALDTEDPTKIEAANQFADNLGEYLWVLNSDQCRDFDKWIKSIHKSFIDANRAEYFKQTGQELPEEKAHVNMLVVIDYLQDLAAATTPAENGDYRAAVGALSRQIRRLANEMFIPFLVVSSSSRAFYAAQEEQKDANLIASAKDSGEVEYDSAAVFHIRRRDAGDFNGLEIVVAKNRFGAPMQSVVFKHDPKTGAIEETEGTADQLKLKVLCDEIGKALYQNPGKFKNAGMIAKELKIKSGEVKMALSIFEAGTYGGYKLVIKEDGGFYLKAPTD